MSLDEILRFQPPEEEPRLQTDEAATFPAFLLTVEQAAPLLGLSRSQIYKLIKAEGLPVVRIDSKIRLSPVALEHWIQAHLSIWEEGTWLPVAEETDFQSHKGKVSETPRARLRRLQGDPTGTCTGRSPQTTRPTTHRGRLGPKHLRGG